MAEFKPPYQTFSFDRYEVDDQKGRLTCHYSFDDTLHFQEVLDFGSPFKNNSALDKAAELYWLLAGVSYYKAYFAPTINCPVALTADDAQFLNTVYRQGLGQFLYENQLDPDQLATFAASTTSKIETIISRSGSVQHSSLVPLGGGKDSLVTVELLRRSRREFTLFRVNPTRWLERQIALIDAPAVIARRILDPQLLEKPTGALNGHIPVTAIISAASLIAAQIAQCQSIVFSNEASANIPNVAYRGVEVNHQYSKSVAFETDFAAYVERHIDPSPVYFSLLAPFTEIRVADLFAQLAFGKYKGWWSSSNDNYKLDRLSLERPSWDLHSPKSLAVFMVLAPFVKKPDLIREVGGNPLELHANSSLIEQLLGLKDFKPFECVADIDEMRWVVGRLKSTGDWPELQSFAPPAAITDPYELRQHRIPDDFLSLINDL